MANDTRRMHRRLFPTAHKLLLDRLVAPALKKIQGDVLVVGAGKIPYRTMLPEASSVFCTDIDPDDTVDLVADAHDLPFHDARFDAVIAIEVFEHLRKPLQAVQEIRRVLRPRGKILLSVPFMFRVHGDPHDYQRFTASGLGALFEDHFETAVQPFGNRLHVISDILTTATRGLAALRIFNHPLCFGPLAKPSTDCPSGYILHGTKKSAVEAEANVFVKRQKD